ncbi:hypothetical protein MKZ38_010701 [Zalerion maritima]|uniref:Uncharacterized protein n=1 Tax=Zalerion maritima TaxID=339359 RepID=A0AAD5WSU3_9PEZI|nr:hypothetical protein MKZ38_010701 [Zalerion maritima]
MPGTPPQTVFYPIWPFPVDDPKSWSPGVGPSCPESGPTFGHIHSWILDGSEDGDQKSSRASEKNQPTEDDSSHRAMSPEIINEFLPEEQEAPSKPNDTTTGSDVTARSHVPNLVMFDIIDNCFMPLKRGRAFYGPMMYRCRCPDPEHCDTVHLMLDNNQVEHRNWVVLGTPAPLPSESNASNANDGGSNTTESNASRQY